MNSDLDDNHFDEPVRWLIANGFELTGGAACGALGFCAGGPVGAAIFGAGGVAIGKVLNSIGKEFSERLLGPREKLRIGSVIACASSNIHQRLDRGESMRDDGFFDKGATGRSDADEIFESVLLKCQREPQEKKIPYMGFMLSNIAFEALVSPNLAHRLLQFAEQMSYQQLCILKLCMLKGKFELRSGDYRSNTTIPIEVVEVLLECYDLYQKSLVHFDGHALLSLANINPSQMTASGVGETIFVLMNLKLIPDDELTSIIGQLKWNYGCDAIMQETNPNTVRYESPA